MRVCGPDHVLHSSDCSGRSRERAAGRASRVCDTCERPRSGPRSGRRSRRNSGGLGRRTTQGRPPHRRAGGSPPLPAIAAADIAETSSPDAIVTQGVVLTGADGLQRAGSIGTGVTIAVLDQAFGAPSRLDALAGSELPPLDRQHRMTFDQTYGLAGRDYNGNSSRHGEFVTEIAYDMAPGATYWFLNYHTPDEFGLAADYIANVLRPDIVIHSNSFLFGPFDGSGWFARKVDAAAAAGVLWVNSAGNYRNRHWEGPWSDADADGNLDATGGGNAFAFQLAATSRPACDLSWEGATADPGSYYRIALFTDPALTTPALHKTTGCRSSPAASRRCRSPTPTCRRARSPQRGRTTSASGASGRRRRRASPSTAAWTSLRSRGSPPRAPPRRGTLAARSRSARST